MAAIDHYLEAVIERAREEARLDASSLVEAEHLLLAVAAEPGSAAHGVLASAGLDRDAVRAALDREAEHSLGAVGVSTAAFGLPPATPHPNRPNALGASARLALERGLSSVPHRRDLRSPHLLAGLLDREVGTVPRALALAGIDRADLAFHAKMAITDTRSGDI